MEPDLNYSLLIAVEFGDLERVMYIVNSYGLSHCPSWSGGYTLLRSALEFKKLEIAKFLLAEGAKINSKRSLNDFKTNTPLHYAVKNSTDVELVEMLLDKNALIDALNDQNETPLHLAVHFCKKDLVRLLLDRGANINAESKNGTPLQIALLRYEHFKDSELIELLLSKNAYIEDKWEGESPLYMAAKEGNEACVRLLLNKEANVNASDNYGMTPLIIACYKGFPKIIELLLKSGASCELSKILGFSPLHMASLKIDNKEVLCLLVDKGSDINAIAETDLGNLECYELHSWRHQRKCTSYNPCFQDLSGCSPLHIACRKRCSKTVELLLSKSANVNLVNKDNDTPLHLAVKKQSLLKIQCILQYNPAIVDENNIAALKTAICSDGGYNVEISNILIDYGFSFSTEDMVNPQLLHAAVKKGLTKIIDYILTSGVDFKSSLGSCTLLHTAAQFGCKEIVKLFIDAGCDVNAKDNEGKTPIDYFMDHLSSDSCLEVAKLLLDSNTGVGRPNVATFLCSAVKKECFQVCEVLVDYFGADVNFVDDCDKTPLLYICENSCSRSRWAVTECTFNESVRKKIAELLLKHGAKVNVGTSIGETALHKASSEGCEGLVHLLLEHGADINAVTSEGTSSLHKAVSKGHYEIVELLVNNGANVNTFCCLNGTPLQVAACNEHFDLIEILLRHCADINQQDNSGKTVLHIASEKGLVSVVNFLLENGADVNIMCNQGNTALGVAKSRVPSSNYQGKSRRRNKSYWFDEDSYQYREHRRYSDDHEYEAHRYEDHYDDEDYEGDFVDRGSYEFVDHKDFFDHQLEHSTREALQLHVIKLYVAGLFVCMKNLRDFPFTKLDWFQDNCRKEINAIKKEKLCCHIKRSRILKFVGSSFDVMDKYQHECEEEIDKLKDVKFCCHTTVDYFLQLNRKLTYLNDEKLVNTLNSGASNFSSFPIYRTLLENNFKYDKQRKELLMPSCEWFLTLLKTRNALLLNKVPILPMEIIEKILLYLDNRTLKNVISCGEQLLNQFKKLSLPARQAV